MLILGGWAVVMIGLVILLVAANRKQSDHLCSDVLVGIRGAGEKFYIEKGDVLKLLEYSTGGKLVDRPISEFDLKRLERSLQTNPWIRGAQLYFDRENVLHVNVDERDPIARVFTVAGHSFYIDSSGHRMPMLEKVSVRVPVVTNYPDAVKQRVKDSLLMAGITRVAGAVYASEFWNAQVGQIDITSDGQFELIPVVGDHVIRLGDGEKVEEQLQNVYVFYRQVLSKVGFTRYATLDARFGGQVVAIRRGPVSAVDSLQLQKNIEDLITRTSLQAGESEMEPAEDQLPQPVHRPAVDIQEGEERGPSLENAPVTQPVQPQPVPPTVTTTPPPASHNPVQSPAKPAQRPAAAVTRPNPVRTNNTRTRTNPPKPAPRHGQPRAVMPRANEY